MAHAERDRAGGAELFRESGNDSPFLKFQELAGAAMRLVYTAQHEHSRGSGGAAAGTLRACELDTRVVVAGSSSSEAAAGPGGIVFAAAFARGGSSRSVRAHAKCDVASANVAEESADAADAHVEISDVTNSLI